MDFLKIRGKAKERAARGSPASSPPAADPAEARPPAPEPPSPTPASSGREDPVRAEDARFTTWKPGSGLRPSVGPPGPPPLPRPDPSAFAVYDPSRSKAAMDLGLAPTPAPQPALVARSGEPAPRRAPSGDLLDDFFYRADEEVSALAGLPAEPAAPATAGADDGAVEEYLTFRLGGEEYAVAIEYVREVLKAPPITEVPRAPAGVLGVINVRGEVVGVFDPRHRLGLPAASEEGTGRIVIVDDGEGSCGLLVDAVASVVRLPRGSVEPCPQGIGGASAECLAGIGRERSRLFTVLDLPALLRRGPAPERGGRREHGEG